MKIWENNMMTEITSYLPLPITDPSNMKPVEQVYCIVSLANKFTVDEIKDKRNQIDLHIKQARQSNLPDNHLKDLFMIRSLHTAAIAYQVFQNYMWTYFVRND